VIVAIDPDSPVPPYEQLRAQIVALIGGGQLPPGSQLPTVRQLASDLGLAPGTIARTYRELEDGGLIETRGRHGTRVSERLPKVNAAERRRRLTDAAAEFVRSARSLGATNIEIEAHLRGLLET
jgi:GntR family transcriptional regulator